MDQTTPPFRQRPLARAARRSLVPALAFWAAVTVLVGARVALFEGIRPGPDTTASVVLAAR
jgi:hypothetical protein